MHIKFWLENLKERDHMEDLGVNGNIKIDLRETGWQVVGWIHHHPCYQIVYYKRQVLLFIQL
jgi:hypothetical protein